jgi:TPP-dependent pyruvate/acetoin dehydrogenase alpha subunit
MFDPDLYRAKAEIEEWKRRDPIPRLLEWLRAVNLVHADEIDPLEKEVAEEIESAVAFAEAAPWEPVSDLARDTYTPPATA